MGLSSDLISLVYLSEAVVPFSKRDLTELLTKSRENNSTLGVTGMLLYKKGNFLQALEGEREKVLELYKKIARDFRHRRVTSLSSAKVTQREFPDWSMGFHDLSSAEAIKTPGFTAFLETNLSVIDFASEPGRAKKLLLLFKEEKLLAKAKGVS
jgi:hypothetical protein